MRWCQSHWDGLRDEVTKQGLSALVPDDGMAAARNLEANLNGEETIDTFDPLMGAMWAVNGFIAGSLGTNGFMLVMTLDGCPVCKMDETHDQVCTDDPCTYGSVAKWFPNAVSDQVAHWKELTA